MLRKKLQIAFGVTLFLINPVSAEAMRTLQPFRVALVIGDQWQDPMSSIITAENASIDFHQITMLLTSWGIPFDIIRLDQQYLNRHMFLDSQSQPQYSVILWLVNDSDQLWHPDLEILTEMVQTFGISFVAFFDYIKEPLIQKMLGIKFIGAWPTQDMIEIAQEHFNSKHAKSPGQTRAGA